MKVLDKPPPVEAPPPPYVPPPEVQPPPAPTAPTIQAVQSTPPEKPAEIKPPPPPAPPAPPAPPPAAPAKTEIGVVCPGHKESLQAALAGLYDKVGVEGVVVLSLRFRGHEIVDVKQVSGPREYFRDVSRAVRRLDCKVPGGAETSATLEISFREQ
jgi:protein TonB